MMFSIAPRRDSDRRAAPGEANLGSGGGPGDQSTTVASG